MAVSRTPATFSVRAAPPVSSGVGASRPGDPEWSAVRVPPGAGRQAAPASEAAPEPAQPLHHGNRPPTRDDRRLTLLRHVARLGGRIEPAWSGTSRHGYVYGPEAWSDDDQAELARDLEQLAREDYLLARFRDRINGCPRCGSHRLNLREVCPSCGSANIHGERLLHHFRCGYVGPEPDFAGEPERVCPKCRHALESFGTDYDSPGLVFGCRACFASFDSPPVEAICLDCRERTASEALVPEDVLDYELTPLGRQAVRRGRLSRTRDNPLQEDESGLYRRSVILALAHDEILRFERYGYPCSIVVFRAGYGDAGRDPGIERVLVESLRGAFREVDRIGRFTDDVLVAVLPNTEGDAAAAAARRTAAAGAGAGVPLGFAVLGADGIGDVETAVAHAARGIALP